MGDMVEKKVARALWAKYGKGAPWNTLEPRQQETWCDYARAALKASCHAELIFTLNTISGFPTAAEETGQCRDYVAGLELAASYAKDALAKVEATDA